MDDEETILEFLGMGLGYEGFTVETASDGPSALAAADRFRPDLVLLGWMLPGLDGVEVCRRLRAKGDVGRLATTSVTPAWSCPGSKTAAGHTSAATTTAHHGALSRGWLSRDLAATAAIMEWQRIDTENRSPDLQS